MILQYLIGVFQDFGTLCCYGAGLLIAFALSLLRLKDGKS